jgi:endoglucanase
MRRLIAWSGTTGYSVFSGCTATALEVTVRVTDPAGPLLDTATTDLAITATAPPCAVNYRVTAQWNHGFVAQVTVTDTATEAITDWTLEFTYNAGQQVTSAWDATFTQASGTINANAMSYDRIIAPGASIHFGLLGTWAGVNPAPEAFTLNGAACRTT